MIPDPRPAVADPALVRPGRLKAEDRDLGMLWLDKNENPDPELAQVVREAIAAVPANAHFTYPDLAPLYAKLATSVGVEPQNLVLAPGSDGAIRAVYETFVSPGETVIFPEPTFAMYPVYARIYGARTVPLAYAPSNAGPVLTADTVIDAIARERPRVVCLPNPDSPTGTVMPAPDLERIVAAAGKAGAAMLVDEAYFPFHADTAVPMIRRHPHLVVVRSTAKAWGMAGLRVGYAVADERMAALLHKVRPMYEVGAFSAWVLNRMLDREDAMRASVARLEAGKRAFLDAMERLGFRTLRGAGNFCHVAFGARADAVHRALADLVYYRKDFTEPCLKGFSRFSAATPAQIAPVIERIEKAAKA